MLSDLPGLFITDGVPADLMRAGKPRVRAWKPAEDELAVQPKHVRMPLLRKHRTLSV